MKKLMIAAFAIAFTAVAQAASVDWATGKGYLYDGNGADSAKITSGTAYLMFVTGDFAQADLVSAFAAANGDAVATLEQMSASGAMATGAGTIGANARIEATSQYSLNGDMNAYFVVFANDKMYVSIDGTAVYDSVSQTAELNYASITASSKLGFDAANGYSEAGWYTAAAVPEPTSALMLLVGLAGLALKRKVA